jgi:hypothetical protein
VVGRTALVTMLSLHVPYASVGCCAFRRVCEQTTVTATFRFGKDGALSHFTFEGESFPHSCTAEDAWDNECVPCFVDSNNVASKLIICPIESLARLCDPLHIFCAACLHRCVIGGLNDCKLAQPLERLRPGHLRSNRWV